MIKKKEKFSLLQSCCYILAEIIVQLFSTANCLWTARVNWYTGVYIFLKSCNYFRLTQWQVLLFVLCFYISFHNVKESQCCKSYSTFHTANELATEQQRTSDKEQKEPQFHVKNTFAFTVKGSWVIRSQTDSFKSSVQIWQYNACQRSQGQEVLIISLFNKRKNFMFHIYLIL